MTHVRKTVLVAVVALALAVGPGAVLAADDATVLRTAPDTDDGGDSLVNSTNATDDSFDGAAENVTSSADATAVNVTATGDNVTDTERIDDATNVTDAGDDATGDVAVNGTYDVNVDRGGSTSLNGSVDANLDDNGDGGTSDASEGDSASTATDSRASSATTVPSESSGRRGGAPVTGGAVAVGVGVVGAGIVARQAGFAASFQPLVQPVSMESANFASHLFGWARDRVWRLVGLAGYQRYADDDPLEHDTRATVYQYLRKSPGSNLSTVSEETDVPLSTLRYHLRVLGHENLVQDAEIRGKRRYFPLGTTPNELDVALNDDAPAAVLETLVRDGPDSVSGLAETLDCDPSTVTYHLQRLEDDGLVERERDGRSVVNRVAPDAEAALSPVLTEVDAAATSSAADAD